MKKYKPEIGLIGLYVDVDVKIFSNEGKNCAHIHKSIEELYVSKYYSSKYYIIAVLLLIPDALSIK